ncbi:MAG: L,D-transpeptidase [Hyphomicrobiaceae bacterium]|nr:L,D-transpeptidase [Hyphomicrobiaceae bacterium]
MSSSGYQQYQRKFSPTRRSSRRRVRRERPSAGTTRRRKLHVARTQQPNTRKRKNKEQWQGGPQPRITPVSPRRVAFNSAYGRGTIVIDTSRRKLFYVLSGSSAYQYPISVGRQGFQWAGTKRITRVQAWPTWRPPAEMRQRQPNLPKVMSGGIYNPLGAKALYLGSTLYRIHGTNNRKSIGQAASSGCFRMLNGHVMHLATIARVGTRVVVLRRLPRNIARSIRSSSEG